jgi:hypothetical protein
LNLGNIGTKVNSLSLIISRHGMMFSQHDTQTSDMMALYSFML